MAKLKRTKKALEGLLYQSAVQKKQLEELSAFMAVLVEQAGGTVTFKLTDAEKVAGKRFNVSINEGVITINLT